MGWCQRGWGWCCRWWSWRMVIYWWQRWWCCRLERQLPRLGWCGHKQFKFLPLVVFVLSSAKFCIALKPLHTHNWQERLCWNLYMHTINKRVGELVQGSGKFACTVQHEEHFVLCNCFTHWNALAQTKQLHEVLPVLNSSLALVLRPTIFPLHCFPTLLSSTCK